MQRARYKNIGQYIDTFSSLIAEFEDCGGNRKDRMVHSIFLGTIPDELISEKSNYSGDTIDAALEYFRVRNDRKLAYKNTKVDSKPLRTKRQRRFDMNFLNLL